MTRSFAGKALPERRWPHYASFALPVLVAGPIIWVAIQPWRVTSWNPLHAWAHSAPLLSWPSLIMVIFMSALLVAVCAGRLHDASPCIVCAANLPLDPSAAAERSKPVFRVYHQAMRWFGWNWMLIYAAGTFLLPLGWPLNCWAIIFAAMGTVFVLSTLRHEKLQPWCPWCRDDGGEGEREPEPDPSARMPA